MTKSDVISLKTIFLLSAITIAACWAWIADHNRIMINTDRIDVIEELYHRSSDRWTGSDMRAWAEDLKRLNPGLKLPAIPNK